MALLYSSFLDFLVDLTKVYFMPEPRIVNPGDHYRPAALVEPSPSGYIHIAAEIDPPRRPGPARPRPARRRALAALSGPARELAGGPQTLSAELFTVAGFTPQPVPERYRDSVGRYDVVVLIKTETVAGLPGVTADPSYRRLLGVLDAHARLVTVTQAGNARRIGDVPAAGRLHLFNHFLTANDAALAVWDYLAGWYQQETGLTNSEVMAPIEPDSTPFAFINHASWDMGMVRFAATQVFRPSFRSFVIANMRANEMSSLPYLYRPYHDGKQGQAA
jgi:hypothetical protein